MDGNPAVRQLLAVLRFRQRAEMNDETRDGLLAKLSDLKRQQGQLKQALQAHGANIEEVRKSLGNPYFYGGRPTSDPESTAHYTGYASHEPAFRLLREYRTIANEVRDVQQTRRQTGNEPV
jgi:hypothetical protein